MTKRVLLVDDNVESRYALTALLSVLDLDVLVASNGTEALQHASHFKTDIALLDLNMPYMDGYELATQLRSLFGSEPLRIIAVSGMPLEAARLHQAGIDSYLRKPIMLETLRRTLGC